MFEHNPVFIPGPTNIPDRLRRVMGTQTRDHRAPDVAETLVPLLEDVKKIFKTETGRVITFPSSGTGGREAAMTNTLSPGDKVLVARLGTFAHRWIDLCQRHKLDVHVIECEWGTGVPVETFEEILTNDTAYEYKAVLVTHNETSTGVTSDVGAVRAAMDRAGHPALLFVDGVSSIGSIDFRMEEWGVDIAVSGSQKGFMLPTGMAILGVSEKAFAAKDTATCPRCFFDFRDMAGANDIGSFPYTPPMQLLLGLRESVDMLLEEGLDNVYARHYRLGEGVRRAVSSWGLELCAKSPELYSNTVSTVMVPEGFDSDVLTNHAYDTYGVSYGAGFGDIAGKSYRIGHLGALTDVMVLSGLATIEMAMKDLGYPIELGSGVVAAQEYYRETATAARAKAA